MKGLVDKAACVRDNGRMLACKHVYYSGRVQGVGFRYTAQNLAEDFAVNGFVRNLPSGEVEVVAEGEASDVDAFLSAIEQRMAGYIDRKSEQAEVSGGYKGFQIRY